MKLTPFAVARTQLLTAIEMFFADKDSVSVHALAGNAREILESLCREKNIEPMTDVLLRDHPGKERKYIYDALNLYRNCFKHRARTEAERNEDQNALNRFDDSKNESVLYVCAEDYIRLRRASPVPMQIFLAWFYALHIDLLPDDYPKQKILDRFPGIQHMTREEQKRGAAGVIAKYSEDPDLLADPGTEPLVLIDQ
jgi:hypothetical protein